MFQWHKRNTEGQTLKQYDIRSGTDLVSSPVPEIPYRIEGLLRANGGRMSITGQWKTEKSLLAQEMGMRIAKGDEWLGFKTSPGNVLYINLEISEEKFQERTQDFFNYLGYQLGNLTRFKAVTILDMNLALDYSTSVLQEILDEEKRKGFTVETLILDPRARTVAKSENEEVVIKALCDNIDKLLRNNPGLSVVFITHMGKDPTKGAIGHSRFVGWVDTDLKIVKDDKLLGEKHIEIMGRDAEKMQIGLDFNYPLHKVMEMEARVRRQKVKAAMDFILQQLESGDKGVQELRRLAQAAHHTDYAFWQARRELVDQGRITISKAPGQGNRKMLALPGDESLMKPTGNENKDVSA